MDASVRPSSFLSHPKQLYLAFETEIIISFQINHNFVYRLHRAYGTLPAYKSSLLSEVRKSQNKEKIYLGLTSYPHRYVITQRLDSRTISILGYPCLSLLRTAGLILNILKMSMKNVKILNPHGKIFWQKLRCYPGFQAPRQTSL